MPLDHALGIVAGQIAEGDDGERKPQAVGEPLHEAGLLHRVLDPDRRLHVHGLGGAGKPRLRDEVVRPVADRLERVVVAKAGILLGIRDQPRVVQAGIAQIVEVNVRVGEFQVAHQFPRQNHTANGVVHSSPSLSAWWTDTRAT